MLPSQVLPAIPRQKVKVKHSNSSSVYDFIGFAGNEENPTSVYIRNYGGFIHEHPIENCEFCEPVPEEPRPFRVGDKVKVLGYYDEKAGDAIYATITAVVRWEKYKKNRYSVSGHVTEVQEEKDLRHATPEEIAKYFA